MQASTKGVDHQIGQPAGDPALKRSFKGHKDSVCRVAFNPNLKQVVSGSADGTVMVWNFKMQLRAFRFVGHKDAVFSVAAAPLKTTRPGMNLAARIPLL